MTAPFLALITPIGETVTPPQPPLGIWGPTDPRPTHPIAPGGQPPRPWGPINYPDQGLPGNQPYPDQGLPGNQPYPDQGLPGNQPRPGQGLPPFPSHPIYFPPEGGQPPLGIWGPPDPRPGFGLPGEQPKPSHPIVLPPDLPEVIPPEGTLPETPIDWKVAWTPTTGWIVVGIPNVPHPTPSR